jgi:hypothetical protein
MEVTALLSVLVSNLCVLALGWAIYAGIGYLLFARSLKACPFLIRLNLYPLLGWAFLVIFAYYLRVLALPYSISGPWCFGALVLGLIIWRGRLPRTRLRSPLPRVLLLLAGFVALNLVPLYLRLAIPDMRDVGTWGYDQRNYVLTAAGLLDEGLLPRMSHAKGPWGLIASYWEYLADSLRQLSSGKFSELDWFYMELQQRFDWLRSASRSFALFPRRAFSSLDALMASVLRIDPQQAYTLSIWIHHLWLLHIGIIFSRLLRFQALGLIIVSLVVVYWPNSHLALAADNRDQANCLILMFVLFIFGKLGQKRFWPIVTCLCAILVGYPELAIPALVAFYAQRYDSALNWRGWVLRSSQELGTSILCILPLLPPALLGLLCQWTSGEDNRTLVFPVQYATPLASFDYLPGWKLLWNDSPVTRSLTLVVDIAILLVAAYGLAILFRRKQFGSLVGYGAVLACGYAFLYRDEYYPAYKVVTVLWPFFVWIVFLPLARILSSPPRLAVGARRYKHAFALVLILCSLPAIISLAQIPIPGAHQLVGANYFLAEQFSRESFLKPRISDVNRLEQISREVSAKQENVLVIADIPEGIPYDFGFAQLFLRNQPLFFPKSFGTGDRVWRFAPYPKTRAASAYQPIDRVLFLNSIQTFNFHRAERHIFGGAFDETAFRRMNFCADLPLRNREELLVLCRSKTGPLSTRTDTGRQSYLIEQNELSLDIYHINAPVGQAARLSFSVTSPNSIPAGTELEVRLDGKVIESSDDSAGAWTRTVWLSPDAMHQQLTVKIKEKEPHIATSTWHFEIGEFEGSTLSRNNRF